jgi:Fibronectin type III domain
MLHHRARHIAHLGGLLALLLTVGMLASSAQAATSPGAIRVATTGTDTTGCGTVAQPCRTPYYAVQQSLTNDVWSGEIRIAAGTYTQATNSHLINLTVYPANIRIIGGFSATDWESSDPLANPTILDGQGVNRAIVISPTDSAAPNCNITIANLTIQNGRGTPDDPAGGGIVINSCQNVRISNVTIKDSISRGADNTNAGATSAGTGGGIAVRGSAAIKAGLTLQNVILQNNQALGGNEASGSRGGLGVGGGLFAINANVRAVNLTLTGNTARGGDAPGLSGNAGGQLADGLGGGIGAINTPLIDINGLTATGNIARGGSAGANGGYGLGGGIFLELSTGNIRNATINSNQAIGGNTTAGGAPAGSSEGGAIHTTGTPLTLDGIIMANNVASTGSGSATGQAYGGALFMTTAGLPSTLTGSNIVVAANQVTGGGLTAGGGIGLRFTTFDLSHVTLADNTLSGGTELGQAIVFQETSTAGTLRNSISSGHTGGSSFYVTTPNTAVAFNRIMSNDTTGTLIDGNAPSLITQSNIITGNPNFVSPSSPDYDYRIGSGSDAIDLAIGSTTTTDLEGQPRPIGAGADIGADEFQVGLTSVGGNGTIALSWDDPPGSTVTSYRIDYTKSAGAANATQGASGFSAGNVNGLTLTGLTNGATYTITVVALNGAVEVTRSRAVTVVASNYPINLPLVVY